MNQKEKQLIHEFVNSPREEGALERSFTDRSVSKTVSCKGEKTSVCIRTVGNVLYVYGKPVLAIFPACFGSSGKKDIAIMTMFVHAPSSVFDDDDCEFPICDLFFCVEKALPVAEYDIIHTYSRKVYVPEEGVTEPEGQTREAFLRKWLTGALTDAADSILCKIRALADKKPGYLCHINFLATLIEMYSKEINDVWQEGDPDAAGLRTLSTRMKNVAEEGLQDYVNRSVAQNPELLSSDLGYYDTSFTTYRRRSKLAKDVYSKTRDLDYSCRPPFMLSNVCSAYVSNPDEDIIKATFIEYVARKAFAVVVANMGEELEHYTKQFVSTRTYKVYPEEKRLSENIVKYCCSSNAEWSNYSMSDMTKADVTIAENFRTGKFEVLCITTNRGAVIRTEAGIRIARKVGNLFLSDYTKVPNIHIDNYRVDRDKTSYDSLIVGCHVFSRHEVERTMRILNMSEEELAQEYERRTNLYADRRTKSITRVDLKSLPGYDKTLREVEAIIKQAKSGPNSYEIKRGRELVERLSEVTELLNAIKELDDEAGMPHTEPMLIMLNNYTCELNAAKARLACAEELCNNTQHDHEHNHQQQKQQQYQ